MNNITAQEEKHLETEYFFPIFYGFAEWSEHGEYLHVCFYTQLSKLYFPQMMLSHMIAKTALKFNFWWFFKNGAVYGVVSFSLKQKNCELFFAWFIAILFSFFRSVTAWSKTAFCGCWAELNDKGQAALIHSIFSLVQQKQQNTSQIMRKKLRRETNQLKASKTALDFQWKAWLQKLDDAAP